MNKNILKNIFLTLGGIFLLIYILFLLVPFMLIPILDNTSYKVSEEIKKTTGLSADFDKFRIVTTPKLTVGIKLNGAKIFEPDGSIFLQASNFQIKASLIPLLVKKIELDLIKADDITLNLKVKPDGNFTILDNFASDNKNVSDNNQTKLTIPFDLKLSNKMPDIRIKSHNITFIDQKTDKKYVFKGSNSNITDFVFNKKIKIESEGKIVLDGFQALDYELEIFNHIMPETEFSDFLLSLNSPNNNNNQTEINNFNIIKCFEFIKDKKISLETDANLNIKGNLQNPEILGEVSLEKISMLLNGKLLPQSNIELEFKKNGVEIESDIYTNENENTKLEGIISSKKLNLKCKSNACLDNIFEIIKQFLNAFNINEYNALKISGKLDADFDINSDYKKINSNGKLKLSSGSVKWTVYDVKIDNLIADILLNNNTVLINKLGFSAFSVPFNIKGKITNDAKLDINVLTEKLSIKNLLISLGQLAILNDNQIYSGLVSINVKIKGELLSPFVDAKVDVLNLKLKNIPSDILLSLNPLNITVNTNKKGYSGNFKANNFKLDNPAFQFFIQNANGTIDENEIKLQKTKANFGKNEFYLQGAVSDYLKEKILLNFTSEGKLNANLTGYINPYKMLLGLNFSVLDNSELIIPNFDKSKVLVNGSTSIQGSLINPILKGRFICSNISIPEIPLKMTDSIFSLDGVILNGSATVKELVSGGISANDVSFDFKLLGDNFYLNNLKGSTFGGEFSGSVIYNLKNTFCKLILKGASLNALKAIEGAMGIKNALTGTLSFNADLNVKGIEYIDMMKSLTGKADFEVKNGVLANLGGLKTLLYAQNIVNNVILKQAADKVSTLAIVQQTSEFNYIKGDLAFSGGFAKFNNILMQGPKMAYYITGKYNLISYSTDAVVLGRISSDVVSVLGNIGNLATSKIVSILPGLGNLTSSIAKMMNESPKNVDISKIPSLSSENASSKEFKAVFKGDVNSKNPVKSFKWLNDVDTSKIEENQSTSNPSLVKENIKQNIDTAVDNVKSNFNTTIQTGKENFNNAKEQAKQLFNSFLNGNNTDSKQ